MCISLNLKLHLIAFFIFGSNQKNLSPETADKATKYLSYLNILFSLKFVTLSTLRKDKFRAQLTISKYRLVFKSTLTI